MSLKPVPGLNRYFVCENGFVYAKDGVYGKGIHRIMGSIRDDGRRVFTISEDNKPMHIYHAKMVALAFHGVRGDNFTARVIDKSKPINPDNVYWKEMKNEKKRSKY